MTDNLFSPTKVPIPTAGRIGWVTLEIADNYFSTRYMQIDHWGDASAGDKTSALWLAYYNLVGSGRFRFPENTQLTNWMQFAQCEQAFYILQQGQAREARMALQAQNVTRADVVKEYYQRESARMDICVGAMGFLSKYRIDKGFGKFVELNPG